MPTIPEEVKALYKQNSISKRLRIHFPNGEREDITNENLEGQTFSFTERICSQSSLKFGLCEASVIEFECFGVEDIKGCKIEVYQEIDISSLMRTEEYQVESTDNSMVLDVSLLKPGVKLKMTFSENVRYFDFTVQYENGMMGYNYPTVLGGYSGFEFTLDSDMGAVTSFSIMLEHDVTGILELPKNLSFEFLETEDVPFPYYRLAFGTFIVDECPRQPDMRHRKVVAYSETYASRFILCEIEKAKQKLQLAEDVPYAFDLQNFIASNIPSIDISSWESVGVSMTSRVNTYTDATGLSGIYSVQATEYTYAVPAEYLDFLYSIDFSVYQEAVEAYGELAKNFPYPSVRKEYLAHIQLQSSTDGIMLPLASGERIYPYMGSSEEYACFITLTTEVVVTTNEYKEYTYTLMAKPLLKRYAGTLTSFELTFPRIEAMNRFKETVYVPSPEIDYSNMLEAWLELNGLFGKNARDGSLQMLSLTEANQVDLEKSDYIDLWYEEQYSKPYGSVSVTFKDADGNAINAEYGIVDASAEGYEESDYQTYSLSGNYLIESRAFSIEEITVILAAFAEKIANIQYMPAKIELQGQPWIEAGDIINVATDEDAIATIVLQRELRGIQALRDMFKAEYSEESGGSSAGSASSGSSGGGVASDVTGVKGNAETAYRTGNVNITPANLGITVVNNTKDADKNVKHATTAQGLISESGNLQDVGNETTPVYFGGGIPKSCGRSLVSVTNNLTATAAGTALDAAQGKVLNDKIVALEKINFDTYKSWEDLGVTASTVTTLVGLIPYRAQAIICVNGSDCATLFANGIIPENVPGTLNIANYGARGYARFITDDGNVYIAGSNNAGSTEFVWGKGNGFSQNNGRCANAGNIVADLNDVDFNSVLCATSITDESSYVANCPKGNSWFYVQTMRFCQGSDFRKQIAYELWENTKMWIRTCSGGTWSDWVEK